MEQAIFAILGAFGVAFGVLYRAVTMGRRRRRRDAEGEVVEEEKTIVEEWVDKIGDFAWMCKWRETERFSVVSEFWGFF